MAARRQESKNKAQSGRFRHRGRRQSGLSRILRPHEITGRKKIFLILRHDAVQDKGAFFPFGEADDGLIIPGQGSVRDFINEIAVRIAQDHGIRGIIQPQRAGCCLLYTSPSPRDRTRSRMPSSA